jgi:hypothetical protein
MERARIAHNDALIALHLGLVVASLILCGLLTLHHLSPREPAPASAEANLPQNELAAPPPGSGSRVTASGPRQQHDFAVAPRGGGPGINWGGLRH